MAFTLRITQHASEDRLEKLIEERLAPGADKKAIDARIWDLFGENWTIMYTDLAGFSRNVAEFGIIHFLQIVHDMKKLLIPVIDQHDGILLKVEGDSLMVIFRNVRRALDCAIAMQSCCEQYNAGRSAAEQILLCVGFGLGRVLRIGDADVFGAEVNAACKLGEDIARPWEVLVTEAVRDAMNDGPWSFEPIDTVPPGAKAAYRLKY